MIELKSVSKHFGAFTAVRSVDLSIRKGEFLTLLGPSGCGKTTLLRMISGFETPSEGSVWLDGEDVTNTPPYRRNVNQVFQSYALFPHLSVTGNIGFGLKMQKRSKLVIAEQVKSAIELVSLTGLEQRKPAELSGGQRQRVALARAIVCQPKVLLLDEPLSALDAKLRLGMQAELKRLQKKLGITFVFVTHDQQEALAMSDRIAVINEGRIEQIGAPAQVYHAPRSEFVASFLGHANILRGKVTDSGVGWITMSVNGLAPIRFPTARSFDHGQEIRVSIRPENIRLQTSHTPGENVFECTIEDQTFKGVLEELSIRTAGGLALSVTVAKQGGAKESFRNGDRVWCSVDPGDFVILGE